MEVSLDDNGLRQRFYCSKPDKVEIITEKQGDRHLGILSLDDPRPGEWGVCISSKKPARGKVITWPEWTWGVDRETIPVWFRGAGFDGKVTSESGQVHTPKGNWLAASSDVEEFVEKFAADKPSQVVVTVHEKNPDTGFTLLAFEYQGSEHPDSIHPKGWLTPLRAACKRMGVRLENKSRNHRPPPAA
jgi:hypothetical protein